uniref:FUN14 domain-containing protein n=1 Tax=Trichobilharzia regenti TaxID=157069 RepID=A0AA85JCM0_TRIRE|nr:unnamed protein product [Trichobilharzia regenti]
MRAEDGERAIVAVQDTLNSIKSRPHRQQVLMGVSSGLVAGYIFAKIGRAAALLLGGTLIALQCAVQQDIIHINWRKVQYAGDRLQSSTPIFGDKYEADHNMRSECFWFPKETGEILPRTVQFEDSRSTYFHLDNWVVSSAHSLLHAKSAPGN